MTTLSIAAETAEITYYPTPAMANKHLDTEQRYTTPVLVIENPYDRDKLIIEGDHHRMRYLINLAADFLAERKTQQ